MTATSAMARLLGFPGRPDSAGGPDDSPRRRRGPHGENVQGREGTREFGTLVRAHPAELVHIDHVKYLPRR